MRVAILSTPRSGNTWVRRVLADLYDLAEIAVHDPAEIPAELPSRVILQLHWYREPGLQRWLREHGFRILVIARHPLDVLLSVLHFVRHEPETARWLDGNAELPPGLGQASPTSPLFAEYAQSWGAENLLGISTAWWQDRDALRTRYEALVQDPQQAFGSLIARLGATHKPLDAALERARLAVWQATWNHHGWRGQPGLWRALLPPRTAWRIYRRHARVFHVLGYKVAPYMLSARYAEHRWRELAIDR